jgi:cytochrome c biogenesis protein ResB
VSAKQAHGKVIRPGWKGGVSLTVLEWVPDSQPLTRYAPARIQYGMQAPPSAIHIISGEGGEGAETWLGAGDRAMLHTPNGNVELAYLPQRVALPFAVRLDRFQIDRYEGSMDPSSYSSRVTVFPDRSKRTDGQSAQSATISMNEPLAVQGITLYQSSYEDAQPRPTVSIFSVNRDPGRLWKYLGSLLIVLGSILLFAVKYRKAKATGAKPVQQEVIL